MYECAAFEINVTFYLQKSIFCEHFIAQWLDLIIQKPLDREDREESFEDCHTLLDEALEPN